MAKLALLIGVSEYEPELKPLPSAVRDVQAIKRVLVHPEMGAFDGKQVSVLTNPGRQEMEVAIELLFTRCQKDDLVVFFFSGHGIKDDVGTLHLSSRGTKKNVDGSLIRSTSVSADFIQKMMDRSRSKRQVAILDCCFSGAFIRGMSAKDDGLIDIKSQLGGEGRVILTSSASTQYSFEDTSDDLSIYTKYLVEGIETGIADQDHDGKIATNELHEYIKRKVQEATPSMKPEFHPFQDGFKIYLAQAPANSSELQYRRLVERWVADRGEIPSMARAALDTRRTELGLTPAKGYLIEQEVLSPHVIHRQKTIKYEYAFLEAIQKNNHLDEQTKKDLKEFQKNLGLTDDDIQNIEKKVLGFQEKLSSKDTEGNKTTINRQIQVKIFLDLIKKTNNLASHTGIEAWNLIVRGVSQAQETISNTRKSTVNSLALINPTHVGLALTIFAALGGAGFFLYTSDKIGKEFLDEAKDLRSQNNFAECSAQISSIPVYTRFSVRFSQDSQDVLNGCDDSFQSEKLALSQAQILMNQATSSEELTVSLEQMLQYLNEISSTSILKADVESLSNNILWEIKQVYSSREKFETAEKLVTMIPRWTVAYQEGTKWVEEESSQWYRNVELQGKANNSIKLAAEILEDTQNLNRIELAREKLDLAQSILNQFDRNNLEEQWKIHVNDSQFLLNETRRKLESQEEIINECLSSRQSFAKGDPGAINQILFGDSQFRYRCSELGVRLPVESDLEAVLDTSEKLCEVIATSLNLRSGIGNNSSTISTVGQGMVLQRQGTDFKRDEAERFWIRVDTGRDTGWVAAVSEENIEYVDHCLTSRELFRANF